MSAAADRQRDHRRRQAAGRIVLRIEVDEVELAEALIAHGLLCRRDHDDRAALSAAASRLLALLPTIEIAVTRNAAANSDVLLGENDDFN